MYERVFTICIGVGDYPPHFYQEDEAPLKWASASARSLHKWAESCWPSDTHRLHGLLVDSQATTHELAESVARGGNIQSLDIAFFYFAGHGRYAAENGTFHLADGVALDGKAIEDLLGPVFHAKRLVILLDCCRSQALASQINTHIGNRHAQSIVIASSLSNELSFEDDNLQQTVFARSILDLLAPKPDENSDTSRAIDLDTELWVHLRDSIPLYAYSMKLVEQHPARYDAISLSTPLPTASRSRIRLTTLQLIRRRWRQIGIGIVFVLILLFGIVYSSTWHLGFSSNGKLSISYVPAWLPSIPYLPAAIELDFDLSNLTTQPENRRRVLNHQIGGIWSQTESNGFPTWNAAVEQILNEVSLERWRASIGESTKLPAEELDVPKETRWDLVGTTSMLGESAEGEKEFTNKEIEAEVSQFFGQEVCESHQKAPTSTSEAEKTDATIPGFDGDVGLLNAMKERKAKLSAPSEVANSMDTLRIAAAAGQIYPVQLMAFAASASADLRFGIFATTRDLESAVLANSQNLLQYEATFTNFGQFLENSKTNDGYYDEIDALARLSEEYAAGKQIAGQKVFEKEDLQFLQKQAKTDYCSLPTLLVLAATEPHAIDKADFQGLGILMMSDGGFLQRDSQDIQRHYIDAISLELAKRGVLDEASRRESITRGLMRWSGDLDPLSDHMEANSTSRWLELQYAGLGLLPGDIQEQWLRSIEKATNTPSGFDLLMLTYLTQAADGKQLDRISAIEKKMRPKDLDQAPDWRSFLSQLGARGKIDSTVRNYFIGRLSGTETLGRSPVIRNTGTEFQKNLEQDAVNLANIGSGSPGDAEIVDRLIAINPQVRDKEARWKIASALAKTKAFSGELGSVQEQIEKSRRDYWRREIQIEIAAAQIVQLDQKAGMDALVRMRKLWKTENQPDVKHAFAELVVLTMVHAEQTTEHPKPPTDSSPPKRAHL